MGQKNNYLHNAIPALYRKTALDIMIYTFIDCQRFTIPGISVENAALSFMKHHKINEDEMSIQKVTLTYYRIQKEIFNEQRSDKGE